jgi:hypothetical protein
MHVATIVQQLAAQRIGEATQCMFGCTIRRLQGNPAVGERRSDLHDDALIAFAHSLQRSHRPVHGAEISHFGSTLDLFAMQATYWSEDGSHGVVDPHIDATPFRHYRRGRRFDLRFIRHVGRQHERIGALCFNLLPYSLQTQPPPCQQRNASTWASERSGGRATDTA